MTGAEFDHLYGEAEPELVAASAGARQYSPLFPGSPDLAKAPPGSLNGLAMLAPPGTLERRFAIAEALRALAPGAKLMALAPKDKGGSRLAGDLRALGCVFEETARRHHRICVTQGRGDSGAVAAAIEAGAARFIVSTGLWSQPGVFSWNRIDPGSALLTAHLPALKGAGADLGCGIGALSLRVLASPAVSRLTMIDIDRRAIEMAGRNVSDPRAVMLWADARAAGSLKGLDFVVMNPPFHEGGIENQALGRGFIGCAAGALRSGGVCWLTANRHLPYEAVLKPLFKRVNLIAEDGGYKIYEARK